VREFGDRKALKCGFIWGLCGVSYLICGEAMFYDVAPYGYEV